MGRKVFISVLGSTNYRACYYLTSNYKSEKIRYVQQATLELIQAKSWNVNDKAYVFVTDGLKGSYTTNWLDNGHKKNQSDDAIEQEGLLSVLRGMSLPFEIKEIHIKEGNGETEIWEIFQIMFELLDVEDDVYIDITHGFRYLPLLTIVLMNFAKFLKSVTIRHISYGNYEGRNEQDEAQIVTLTSFSELQDWTSAAASFIKTGDTFDITKLIENEELNRIFRKFSDIHTVVRGKDLYAGKIQAQLASMLKNSKLESPAPFEYIKKEIIKKVELYNDNILNNGLVSIGFCIDHNLIQQGFTLLDEFVITYVLFRIDYNWGNLYYRNAISSCLSISNKERFDFSIYENALQKDLEQGKITLDEKIRYFHDVNRIIEAAFLLPEIKKLANIMKRVSHGSRNDINHAGMREEPREANLFKDSLLKHYDSIKTIVLKYYKEGCIN
ncbi:MAG: TIGR02221 family CRISPR-associated protein [Bacteroidales bacterium]|nr:TIGR02221 family CRISPR-associated protein [Bacteroidales bacterium]